MTDAHNYRHFISFKHLHVHIYYIHSFYVFLYPCETRITGIHYSFISFKADKFRDTLYVVIQMYDKNRYFPSKPDYILIISY